MFQENTELELSDDQLQNISGGCTASGVSLGGLHFGFGGLHLGGGFHYGFSGFSGFGFAPVQQVALVPVQSTAVVAEPVSATVAATSCSQGVTLAAGC